MSNLLKLLNKYRTKTDKPKSEQVEMAEAGSTPVEDLALPKEQSGYEEWAESQRMNPYSPQDNEPDENGEARSIPHHPPILPVAKAFNKRKFDDYRPGPVKIFTREEIEEYERERQAKE